MALNFPTPTSIGELYVFNDRTWEWDGAKWNIISLPAPLRTAGDGNIGALTYNGLTRTAGQLYGGTVNPTSTTRLNYDGTLHANKFVGEIDGGEF
jgi:hypothetical protein